MLKYLKKSCLLILVLFFSCSLAAATSTDADVKSLFDRYQSVFSEYREAIENNENETVIKELSQKLQAACSDYYQALGIKSQDKNTFDSDKQTRASDEGNSGSPQISAQASYSGYKKDINPFQ
jgi:conjugal transfer/entry exclusion protein